MIIKGGNVFLSDGKFHNVDVCVKNGVITHITDKPPADDNIIDAVGFYIVPGFCDVHTHGAMGFDFSDGDVKGLKKIAEYEKASGVTSFCPTSMTIPKEELFEVFKVGAKAADTCKEIVGFHMEGPFISPLKKGAQKEEDIIAADEDFFDQCQSLANGKIKLVTLAPEMPGNMEFVKNYSKDIHISVGHTTADYDTAMEAFKLGACHVTHLFNAMPPFLHRQPSVVGAALDSKNVFVEMICDGVHVHDSMIRAMFDAFDGRVVMISDSMRATGLSDGKYTLGGQEVYVEGNIARLSDGTIAGSVTNLYDCVRYVVEIGVPLEKAIEAASITPARSIGIDDKAGSIEVGKQADFLIMDKDLNLVRVIS